ncbi:MAG: hypothetical protein ACLTW9_29120 [Enterocloster sp.]
MARWTRDEVLNQPADFVQFMMEDLSDIKAGSKKDPQGTRKSGRRAMAF